MTAAEVAGPTTYTGPALSVTQLSAISSIAGRGDLWHVNPSTAGVLIARGLVVTVGHGHRVNSLTAVELTPLGRAVLADARATGVL